MLEDVVVDVENAAVDVGSEVGSALVRVYVRRQRCLGRR